MNAMRIGEAEIPAFAFGEDDALVVQVELDVVVGLDGNMDADEAIFEIKVGIAVLFDFRAWG